MKKAPFLKLLFVIPIFMMACGGQTEKQTESEKLEEDSAMLDSVKTQINKFVHIFPSHLKVALMFKNAGLKYDNSLLLDQAHNSKLVTTYDRALGLGFYGVDMAYTAINNQTQTSINILKISKSLSQQLGLESVYESNKYVERFESNLDNVDSLSSIIGDLFAETDAFFKDNDKLDVTLLTFAGGWTESVFIAASLAKSTKNKAIVELVGDQLISLNPLIKLLGENQKNFDFNPLIKQLNETKAILESGIVTPETETEPMVFDLDDKKLEELLKKLKEIRSKIENA
jgi:hypothetical protein